MDARRQLSGESVVIVVSDYIVYLFNEEIDLGMLPATSLRTVEADRPLQLFIMPEIPIKSKKRFNRLLKKSTLSLQGA